jgi:hypothetical protein
MVAEMKWISVATVTYNDVLLSFLILSRFRDPKSREKKSKKAKMKKRK